MLEFEGKLLSCSHPEVGIKRLSADWPRTFEEATTEDVSGLGCNVGQYNVLRQIGQLVFCDRRLAPSPGRSEGFIFNKVAKPEGAAVFATLYGAFSAPTVKTKFFQIIS